MIMVFDLQYEPSHTFLMLALSEEHTFSKGFFLFMNVCKVNMGVGAFLLLLCSRTPLTTGCVWTGLQTSAFSTPLQLTCRVKLDDDSAAFSCLHNSLGCKVPVTWFRPKSYPHKLCRCSHISVNTVQFFVFLMLFDTKKKS